MKVALYIRVSTQEQAKEGYSIGEQEERLKNYSKAMLWDIYKIYADPGYSGGDTNRPGLKDLIRDVENGKVDKVVVYKLDRLSRSQKDTLILIEDVFLKNNVDFVSMSENFDTSTPIGRAVLGLLAVFAQLERDQIKERMNMGREARAKQGKWTGGTEPIGYDYNISDNMLYPNEYEQLQLKELRELFLQGVPLKRIQIIFEEKGYTHKHGKWDPKAMRRVLGSKLYLGYLCYHDEWYPAEHEPTLDIDTFNKIEKLLKSRADNYKTTGAKPGVPTTYLGGLLYCKHCGGKYSKQENSRRKEGNPRVYWYMCYSRCKKNRKMIKDPNCKNKNWKIKDLDELVFNEIRRLAMDPEYIHDIRRNKVVKSEEPNRVDIIQKEIEKLDEQISRFMDLYGIGKFTIEQVSQKVDPLNEQKTKLERELNELNAEKGALTVEEAIEIINSFEEIFERGDFNEIRLFIESIIYYIEIDNDDVYIHWKFA